MTAQSVLPARPGHLCDPRLLPGVSREEVGFRIQVTAANTDEEVSELLAALDRLADAVSSGEASRNRRPSLGVSLARSGKYSEPRRDPSGMPYMTSRHSERGGGGAMAALHPFAGLDGDHTATPARRGRRPVGPSRACPGHPAPRRAAGGGVPRPARGDGPGQPGRRALAVGRGRAGAPTRPGEPRGARPQLDGPGQGGGDPGRRGRPPGRAPAGPAAGSWPGRSCRSRCTRWPCPGRAWGGGGRAGRARLRAGRAPGRPRGRPGPGRGPRGAAGRAGRAWPGRRPAPMPGWPTWLSRPSWSWAGARGWSGPCWTP